MTGYSTEDVLGKPCSVFTVESCCGNCRLFSDDIKKPLFGVECKIRTKDGRILITSKNIDSLKDDRRVISLAG